MELVPLHQNLHYLEACADVLNEEWTRSKAARLHSLEKSCDDLPTCLLLLDERKKLIGHSRLSQIRGKEGACLVESVVVRKDLRGQGHGRTVMEKTERYAQSKGFKCIYLTTHDKQGFYQKLGYEFCEPVISLGGDFANLPESFTKALSNLSGSTDKIPQKSQSTKSQEDVDKSSSTMSPASSLSAADASHFNSVPPAPSPIQTLTPYVPPPPPPPPPVKIPPLLPSNPSIVRWDPSKISWMKKAV